MTRRESSTAASGPAGGGMLSAAPVPQPANPAQKKLPIPVATEVRRTTGHRDTGLLRDSTHIIERDGICHVISEDYSYKTGPYYTILDHELRGKNVRPASSAVLEAYVVPLCLERAKLAGIPVADWGISQGYVPLPSVIYGLNYFATSADYMVVRDDARAKEAVLHVTNKGKYPFCYQKIPHDAAIHACVGIFGRTTNSCSAIAGLAEQIYALFSIPLVTMVFIRTGDSYLLSSLSPAKYSKIPGEERALLTAYLSHQEFL
jgi:hypothetical protein